MAMSPGTYVRKRREAACLSIEDIALAIGTAPRIPALDRAEWIALVERDELPVGMDMVEALSGIAELPFDKHVLVILIGIARGEQWDAPALCRVCACSWWDPCLCTDGGDCAWVDGDLTLCTACAGRMPAGTGEPEQPDGDYWSIVTLAGCAFGAGLVGFLDVTARGPRLFHALGLL